MTYFAIDKSSQHVVAVRWCWKLSHKLLAIVFSLWVFGCATPPVVQQPVQQPVIPAPPLPPPQVVPPLKPPPPPIHRVRQGEGLYAIASSYGLDYLQVAEWNGIPPPYNIRIGQVLRLRPGRPAEDGAGSEAGRDGRDRHNQHIPRVPTPSTPERPLPTDHIANKWIWPTKGRKVVQTFLHGNRTRNGIRISGEQGQTVVAAESGRVIYSGNGPSGYGLLIIIKHARSYLSVYGFNSKLLVTEESIVTKGQHIAEMGLSAEGKPMLHFEIRRGDVALNPLRLLPSK